MRLRDICSVQIGYTARSRLEPALEGVPVIQLRDLTQDGAVDPDQLVRVRLAEPADRYAVSAGDVLFRSRGDLNLAVALDARFVEPAIAVLPLMILLPRTSVVLPEYLAWAINQPATQRYFDVSARGTSLRMVSKASLEDLQLDLPDLETQRLIVTVADLAAREAELLRQLAKLKRDHIDRLLAEHAHRKRSSTKNTESRR